MASIFTVHYTGNATHPQLRYTLKCTGTRQGPGWRVQYKVEAAAERSGYTPMERTFTVEEGSWNADIAGLLARTSIIPVPAQPEIQALQLPTDPVYPEDAAKPLPDVTSTFEMDIVPEAYALPGPLRVSTGGPLGYPTNPEDWQELAEALECLASARPAGPLRFMHIDGSGREAELCIRTDVRTRTASYAILQDGKAVQESPLDLGVYKELRALLTDVVMAKEPHSISDPPQPGFYLDDGRGCLRAWSTNVSQDPRKDRLAACLQRLQDNLAPHFPHLVDHP